ncbi:hypothetical protein CcaverHIS002_0300450 [Cutaneotrichosporon cavernicola]|uniref:HTH CENPB-type domain-containing protein n=1 Tax=Cutaneotrichosporon cavernicola TaxID=279322 RepID=A0AA48L1P4_9TREE|nr:uncharacterized protein CcaverHIS019_0300450 [Cutaneotrichosporon cavernicola]BEI82177.1 hypothetical protein CcaverHIS002_0300450 [Cutaneotrichosporon cavernicola]BEI89975.1 hypothetical protein CcaverHIS019_0300450 [Cutaneotrichosporon cavernicola]BEI97747.1 hypothetical protein CcaverHIS631_0300460 [Cutaneotrichosporon cavernicola]BEJ05525.1 hypothetical protein CcaverHIS641_0300470 [Cutaneotrichosporon cavernicola]
MAATMTTYAPILDAAQHEEVDFMTMFTNQNDDVVAKTEATTTKPALTQGLAAPAGPAPTTLPAADPLPMFDAHAPPTADASAWQQQQHAQFQYPLHPMSMPVPHGVAYPAHMMYHPQPPLGPPFMPGQMGLMAQYVEPAALPGAQPAYSAYPAPPSALPTSADIEAKPMVTTPPATGASAGTPPASTAATANGRSPSSGTNSPNGPAPPAAGRRKRKLMPEDKRRICEIYRNSQGKIRQEDIAKEYSVDRSTISKILNQEERWLDPEQSGSAAGLSRRPGGRYPAIEEDIHRWLDEAVLAGREVRDSEAREEALKIGLRLGHPHFQASSKWWDGVKRRRLEEGRAMPMPRRPPTAPRAPTQHMPGLVRTYTMDMPSQSFPMAGPSAYPLIAPGVLAATGGPAIMPGMPQAMRARSQSSPQVFNSYVPAQQAPSSGPAPRQRMSPPRHSPVTPLSRNRSYHGSSAGSSPIGRPSPLHRANSSGGRPSPHLRLGASAFGLTPMSEPQNVLHTPTHTNGLAEMQHAGTTTPTTSATASMPSLSPLSMSESSDMATVPTVLSPSTPCTPAQPTFAVVPGQPEHMDMVGGCAPQSLIYTHHPQHMVVGGYPGSRYAQPMYPGYEYVQGQW